ncbi:DUF2808 domain-containing protein [Gloeocapsa sp. PCC 73106]|uniref:DUF2808 domain-containing protein n=1 Tax=Gloeocapsa sp. PCC 73106 TaxID=102232 RepID=UPI0002ABE8F1|nr:DUF2808 domain-containing protein [Gloeocapsa sp. PCC 73106]ELR98025.1 Protein of unknown function (DUF2808) [Gloeocapsa sp. PCC 73106]
MSISKFPWKVLLAGLTLFSGILSVNPIIVKAQSNPGLTIFGGVDRENQLSYYLDFGGRANNWDRYRLRIPGEKLTEGATRFIIKYPDYFEGKFDPDKVEVRVGDESLPIRGVIWDQENYLLEIDLENPLTEARKVEIVLSNVKNPRYGGTFYFNCDVVAAGEIPIRLYVGTWIISIG